MKTKTLLTTLAILITLQFAYAQEFPKGVPVKVDMSTRSQVNYSDWEIVAHTGTQRNFTSIQFTDDSHGWIVGEFGTLMYTSDAGLSWEEYYFGPSIDLNDVYFLDNSTGFVVGTVSIGAYTKGIAFKTIDGGQHWDISYRSESSMLINAISFSDNQNGFISGCNISPQGSTGVILRTSDGGLNWNPISINHLLVEIDNISFNTSEAQSRTIEGWATGRMFVGPSEVSVILQSENDGYNWNTVVNTGAETNLSDINFCSSQYGIAVGDNGSIMTTKDAGKRWITQYIRDYKFNASLSGENNNALIIGEQGMIFSTEDNGRNWMQEYTLSNADLNAICETPNGLLWIVGDEGTLYVKRPQIIDENLGESPVAKENHFKDGISEEVFNHDTEKIAEPLERHKIFPNPSSGQTTIAFELSQESHIKLDVYSINGQLVRTIVNQVFGEGSHNATLDANSLSSGMYTYILKAGNHIKNGKLIVN